MSEKWRVGGAIFLPQGTESYDLSFLAVGLTATSARPGRIGPDLAVVIVPRALQFGGLVGGIRANAGLPIPLSASATLVPSAGVTVIGAAGAFGVAGVGGLNATVALHLFSGANTGAPSKTGLRIALGQHRFSGGEGGVTFMEIGFVRR